MTRLQLSVIGAAATFITALLFTLERIAAYTRWHALVATGVWPEEPAIMDILAQNWFIPLFGFTALICFFMAGNSVKATTMKTGTTDL
ncbi:hypothetical protein [Exiguobacterium sp.]|uniref:hypothetical protein n=1 Tax=Exiguobacterium sp. TaxID=44751 RepID=UPI00391C69AE